MKILITGAAGFIGFHLSILYLKKGHTVYGVDNLNKYYSPHLKSKRLNGKPLKDINGIPMIVRTYNQCLKAINKDSIFIATEDNGYRRGCG